MSDEMRYIIGTVNQWDMFQADGIGSDPDLTTFEIFSQALEEIHECINQMATVEPITNAAVYDNHLDRIVWRQENN